MDQIVALDDVVFGDYFSETSQQTSCDETSVLKTTNPLKSKQLHSQLKLMLHRNVGRLVERCSCKMDRRVAVCAWCQVQFGPNPCNVAIANVEVKHRCGHCVFQVRKFFYVRERNFLLTSVGNLAARDLTPDVLTLVIAQDAWKTRELVPNSLYCGPFPNEGDKVCSVCSMGMLATACPWCKWNMCGFCSRWLGKCDNCVGVLWDWVLDKVGYGPVYQDPFFLGYKVFCGFS